MRPTFIALIVSLLLACAGPKAEHHYTRISQQGASWQSSETLIRLDSALVLISETADLTDTFPGIWAEVNDVQTFKGTSFEPIVAFIAPDGAMIIWPDGMISRLHR